MPDQQPSLSSQALILEHLKMLQPNIDRVNRSSFQCKALSMGLLAAVAGTKSWAGHFVYSSSIQYFQVTPAPSCRLLMK
jgi:hypothetical protein